VLTRLDEKAVTGGGSSNGGQRPSLNSGFHSRRGWPIRSAKNNMKTNDKKYFAWISLILAITGVTGPFVIAIFASEDQAIGFALVCIILALFFGVISWRHLPGRVSSVICLIALTIFGAAYIRYTARRDQILNRATKAHSEYQSTPNKAQNETQLQK
jgi:cell division protein FtsW (lipid II flippase)